MRTRTVPQSRRREELRTLILASLERGTKHGYAIRKDLKETFGAKVGQGALYGALNVLLEMGFIAVLAPVFNRQPYEITEAGRAELRTRLAIVRKLVEAGARDASGIPSYYVRIDGSATDKELAAGAALPDVTKEPLPLDEISKLANEYQDKYFPGQKPMVSIELTNSPQFHGAGCYEPAASKIWLAEQVTEFANMLKIALLHQMIHANMHVRGLNPDPNHEHRPEFKAEVKRLMALGAYDDLV